MRAGCLMSVAALGFFRLLSAVAGTPAYTVEDCVASGLARSARLANAGRDSAISETRIRQVRAQILPQVTARGDYTYQEELPVAGGQPMGRADNYLFSGEISQLLYSGGSVQAGLRAAAAYRELALAIEKQARAEIERDIRQAFADALLAQAVADVRAQAIAQLEAWVAQVEARHRQGTVAAFELNSARVRLANERPPLIRARADVALARSRLGMLARLDAGPFELRGELSYRPFTNSLEQLRRDALDWRPELLQARQRVTLDRADIRAAQGRYAPQVRLRAGSSARNPPPGSALDEFDWGWNAGLTAEWTLFDGGLREAEIAQKRLELAKSEETLGELRRLIALEIEILYAERLRAAEAVSATAENEALARQNFAIARTRYEAGLVTHLEFSDAELALRTASLSRLEALAAHERAVAGLVCARGRPPRGADGGAAHEQP